LSSIHGMRIETKRFYQSRALGFDTPPSGYSTSGHLTIYGFSKDNSFFVQFNKLAAIEIKEQCLSKQSIPKPC
jgi:hypothetical protein